MGGLRARIEAAATHGDRSLERDDGGDDDNDALDGVADGVRDRVDAAEGEEGDLVVEVVEGAREERLGPQVARLRAR